MKQFFVCLGLLCASQIASAQSRDPFAAAIEATDDVIVVAIEEFASLPGVGDLPAQMKTATVEPGSGRLLVSDMSGIIYRIDENGAASPYLDMTEARWAIALDASWREQGLQSFAMHPQFAERGSPGFGKFYTWFDSSNTAVAADFSTASPSPAHHTVLAEWTARDSSADRYDGAAPRAVLRLQQPFRNHNGGAIAFNPVARPTDADYGMLYLGVGDGGSGGDPLKLGQDRGSAFAKILRIDPLGSDSRNGNYGIPKDNPFVGQAGIVPEIYAYGPDPRAAQCRDRERTGIRAQ